MPLTLYSDTSEQCRQRGLAINTTVDLITQHGTIESSGSNSLVDRNQLVQELEAKEFLVPQATLKRYMFLKRIKADEFRLVIHSLILLYVLTNLFLF